MVFLVLILDSVTLLQELLCRWQSPAPRSKSKATKSKKIQTKYYYLRKNTETKKGWGEREYNRVRDKLHKITTRLVDYAEENNLIIVVGNLKGIQNQDKGKEMNRKLHRFHTTPSDK